MEIDLFVQLSIKETDVTDYHKILNALDSGDAGAVNALNASLHAACDGAAIAANAVEAGVVIVTNDYYSDPDAFVNKFEVWATEFENQTGLKEHFWFWRNHPVNSDVLENYLTKSENGQWVIVFYGPMFQRRKSLGALILTCSDGKMGYVVDGFTHGSGYNTDHVKVPGQVKRGKDLAKMIAAEATGWVANHLLANINSVETASVRRNKSQFVMDITVEGDVQSSISQINSELSNLGFSVGSAEADGTSIHVTANHSLKLFSNF